MNISSILDKARDLLSGEPARAIGYGAAAVIYLVAYAFDAIPDVTPEVALASAAAAIVTIGGVIESIRRFVSPAYKVDDAYVAGVETGYTIGLDEGNG